MQAGLQAERTSLAWHRTILVLVVDGLLFLRMAITVLPQIAGYLWLSIGSTFILFALFLYIYIQFVRKEFDHVVKLVLTIMLASSSFILVLHFLMRH